MTLSSSGLSFYASSSRGGACRRLPGFLPGLLACLLLPATGAWAQPAKTQATDTFALYTRCSFRPQGPGCAMAYQKALTEKTPGAAAIRQAFHDYAQYLTPAGSGLTATDRQFLEDSGITLPRGLTEADMAGLHNVINDPAFRANKAARQAAVNNFLSRAVEAGLYCDLGSCKDSASAVIKHGPDSAVS